MPEVGITISAQQFDPAHPEAVIRPLNNTGLFEFGMKTGPATARIEFAVGVEQCVIATDTMVLAAIPALFVDTAERRLGAGLPRNPVLFRIELLFPLLVSFMYF